MCLTIIGLYCLVHCAFIRTTPRPSQSPIERKIAHIFHCFYGRRTHTHALSSRTYSQTSSQIHSGKDRDRHDEHTQLRQTENITYSCQLKAPSIRTLNRFMLCTHACSREHAVQQLAARTAVLPSSSAASRATYLAAKAAGNINYVCMFRIL